MAIKSLSNYSGNPPEHIMDNIRTYIRLTANVFDRLEWDMSLDENTMRYRFWFKDGTCLHREFKLDNDVK